MKKTILSLVAAISLSTMATASDKVYATVNGENITNEDISMIIRDPRVQYDTIPEQYKKQVLDQTIEQKLLFQNSMKSDVINSKEYKEQLEKTKQAIAFQIWAQKIAKDIKVTQKEIKEFYEKNKAQMRKPLELNASHILVKTESEAKDIINELKKAKNIKETFTSLAKSKSTGPSSKDGGDLGWFTTDKMVPEFSNATIKLAKGSFTKEPVKTQFGYHVILLNDKKKSSVIKYEEIKDKLSQQVSQEIFLEKLKKIATDLKSKAKIEYK